MPLSVVIICKTVAVVTVVGIGALLAIYKYRHRSSTSYHTNNNGTNNGGTKQDGATSRTSTKSNGSNDKPTTTHSTSPKSSSCNCQGVTSDAQPEPKPKPKPRVRKNVVQSQSSGVCSFCLEDFDGTDEIPLSCKHWYHYKCAVICLQESDCPVCEKTTGEKATK